MTLQETDNGKLPKLPILRQGIGMSSLGPSPLGALTAGADGAVKLWDAVLGTETFELRHGEPLAGAAMTRDGFQLIAGGWDGTLTFWDATPIVRDPGQGALRSAE